MTSPRSVAPTVQEAGDFGLTTQLSPKLHVSEGSTRSRHSSVDGDCVARLTTPAASILPDFKAHHQALRTVAATEVQIASPLMLTRMRSRPTVAEKSFLVPKTMVNMTARLVPS
jgi:hypothetical protein